ncbi:hypothetical protein FB446DRAFT_810350 [Lentinula raphanica]|nr:hypothetical protein FB446DRAFT_810350 [Lentinula raphanica]
MTRASDFNTRLWLDGVLNPSNAGESELSQSENPPPDHEEPAHGAPSYVQPAHDAAPPGRYVASPYGQPTYGGSTHGYEAPSYSQPPPGVAYSHGVSPHGQPAHGGSTHRYEAPSYGQPPPPGVAYSYGVSPYGQPAHGGLTHGYEAPSYGQPPPGVATYSYGVSPHGQPAHGGLTHGYEPSDGQPAYRASTDMTHGNVSPHNQPAPAVVTYTYGVPMSYDRSAPASHGNEAPSYGQPASGVASYGYGAAPGALALDIIFTTFRYRQNKVLTSHIEFEIGPDFPISLETIPYDSLLPSQDERGQWNDQLLKFDNGCKYGRKKIGTVTFRAGNTENPETIMKRVADAARKDQSMDYTRNNMYRRVDFSDKFFYGLKGESGVDMEPQTIEHWEFVKDQYRTMWKEEKDHRKTIDNVSHRNTRKKLREKGLNSRGKPLRGAPRHAQKDSEAQRFSLISVRCGEMGWDGVRSSLQRRFWIHKNKSRVAVATLSVTFVQKHMVVYSCTV